MSDNNDLYEPISRFLAFARAQKGLSEKTCLVYQKNLQTCIAFLSDAGLSSWQSLDDAWIRQLAAKAKRQGLKPSSIALRLSALRSFLDFLVYQGELAVNPAKSVSAPKKEKMLPKNLDIEQIEQLVSLDDEEPLAIRDRAIMELMYGAGLRLSELVKLDKQDLYLQQEKLRVLGKGNKERILPFSGQAKIWVSAWLSVRVLFLRSPENALFLSQLGRRISVRTVQSRMEKWGLKQSLASHVNPHKLRHSFATHVLESSGDIRAVQELLGHANLSTTQIYTHLDFQHLANVYDSAHPRARKKKKPKA